MTRQQKAAATRRRNREARLAHVTDALRQISREHQVAAEQGNHRVAAFLIRKAAVAGRERRRLRWSS